MRRRPQLIPWKVAGRVTEQQASADDVVQATGWVFNNETGDTLTLAEFVATGDNEVPVYLERFGLLADDDDRRSLVEIGCGIGRMTCAFTRRFGTVFACDLDAGFLERCREAVASYGKVDRLRTVEVADGRSLDLPDGCADIAFSYITLQHCERDDAVALVAEAVRVVRPGGQIALNFRAWSGLDPFVLPIGIGMRALFRAPVVGPWLSHRRLPTRLCLADPVLSGQHGRHHQPLQIAERIVLVVVRAHQHADDLGEHKRVAQGCHRLPAVLLRNG